MKTVITGGTLVTPHKILPNHTLVVKGKKIIDILAQPPELEPDDAIIEAKGNWVTPGLIDVHTHGALGMDTMQGTEESIQKMACFFARHGVTTYLPTTWAAAPERILDTLNLIAGASQAPNGAQHLGVHIEGPYINPKYRGAQREEFIRNPDPVEYDAWLSSGVVRLVTMAPELEGANRFIEKMTQNGVVVSIGHSGADYSEVIMAADYGARQVTHLYNGMSGLHHRDLGTLGACLAEDRLYTQIIPDGVHLHPEIVKLTIRAKTNARVILITDSICGTAMPDGNYDFDGQIMNVQQGVARTPEGGLSGSTLTMDKGVRNVLDFTGLPINQVLPMATSVPAEAMGLVGQKGILQPGADADVLLVDRMFNVLMTMVSGRIVYERNSGS